MTWFIIFSWIGLIILYQKVSSKRKDDKKLSKTIKVTGTRKLFHALICLVYGLGLICDRQLLYICSFGMLILLILLEVFLETDFID
jgi:hypothetical protein